MCQWANATDAPRAGLAGVPESPLVTLTPFGLYSHRINLATETVQQRIDAIGKNLPPPPVPVHKLRLKFLLANEIAGGLLTVEEDDHHSRV